MIQTLRFDFIAFHRINTNVIRKNFSVIMIETHIIRKEKELDVNGLKVKNEYGSTIQQGSWIRK